MKYDIRNASEADEQALVILSRKTINHSFRSFMGDEAVDGFIDSGMADKEITDNLGEMLVLEKDEKIIGLCIWHDALLHLMMVDPDFHGTGASVFFINKMVEDKLKIYSEVYLECFENNERANAYYKKTDWTEYKTEIDESMGWNRVFYKKS